MLRIHRKICKYNECQTFKYLKSLYQNHLLSRKSYVSILISFYKKTAMCQLGMFMGTVCQKHPSYTTICWNYPHTIFVSFSDYNIRIRSNAPPRHCSHRELVRRKLLQIIQNKGALWHNHAPRCGVVQFEACHCFIVQQMISCKHAIPMSDCRRQPSDFYAG